MGLRFVRCARLELRREQLAPEVAKWRRYEAQRRQHAQQRAHVLSQQAALLSRQVAEQGEEVSEPKEPQCQQGVPAWSASME